MPGSVRVVFYATAREAVGRSRLERPIANDGVGLDELLAALASEFPRLPKVLSASRLVVNGEYVTAPGTRVRPGDEVAVHPPYSGG
jgi:molybdopterin converting factor small subunit